MQRCNLIRDIQMNVPMTEPVIILPDPPPVNVAALVCESIEELVFAKTLHHEDAGFKAEFTDCFPSDIPHLNDLPTDVFHEINLKDANMTIVH